MIGNCGERRRAFAREEARRDRDRLRKAGKLTYPLISKQQRLRNLKRQEAREAFARAWSRQFP